MILSITFWGLPTYCDLTRQSVCFIRRKWELSLMLIMASQLYSGASYWPTLLLHRQRKYTLITSVREGSRHRQRQTDRDRHRQRKYRLISSMREGSRNLTWIGWLPIHLVLCGFGRQWWWVVFVRLVKTSHSCFVAKSAVSRFTRFLVSNFEPEMSAGVKNMTNIRYANVA